jgi:hypothetical protein
MKRIGILASISIVSLVFGSCACGLAQDQQDKDKRQDRQQDKQQGQSTHQDRDSQPQHPQDQARPQPATRLAPRDNARPAAQMKQVQRTDQQQQDQQSAQKHAWPERRANHFQYERQSWQQRGGYQGIRVADDYFRDHYGSSHAFRIYGLPFLYQAGNPSFQYDGYWFTLMDPYPENWQMSWYQDDDVYIDYRGDGYYLFNRTYPGHMGIALNITNE